MKSSSLGKFFLGTTIRKILSAIGGLFFCFFLYFLVYPGAECKSGCGVLDKMANVAQKTAETTTYVGQTLGLVKEKEEVVPKQGWTDWAWDKVTWRNAGYAVGAAGGLVVSYYGGKWIYDHCPGVVNPKNWFGPTKSG